MVLAAPSAALRTALAEAGGAAAHSSATARLRALAGAALDGGRLELTRARSGYADPVAVLVAALAPSPDPDVTFATAAHAGVLVAAVPVPSATRADPDAATAREWTVAAHAIGALVDAAEALPPPSRPDDLLLRAADLGGHLLLVLPGGGDAAFAALAFEERSAEADRLRAAAHHVPAALLADAAHGARPPIGAGHPLRIAEAVARLGGDPADPSAADALDDGLALVIADAGTGARPHEDPDPARRVARRIAQRLSGMGKWGGFHTEFAHLPRGFAGNDRALATQVGEAMLAAGLLLEKPSVGQRHVYLNSRRAGDIHRLIDEGAVPSGLHLPPV